MDHVQTAPERTTQRVHLIFNPHRSAASTDLPTLWTVHLLATMRWFRLIVAAVHCCYAAVGQNGFATAAELALGSIVLNLFKGRPTRIVVWGGSMTFGENACTGKTYDDAPTECAWPARLEPLLRGRPGLKLANGTHASLGALVVENWAVRGTFTPCTSAMNIGRVVSETGVQQAAQPIDLILIDYAVNDERILHMTGTNKAVFLGQIRAAGEAIAIALRCNVTALAPHWPLVAFVNFRTNGELPYLKIAQNWDLPYFPVSMPRGPKDFTAEEFAKAHPSGAVHQFFAESVVAAFAAAATKVAEHFAHPADASGSSADMAVAAANVYRERACQSKTALTSDKERTPFIACASPLFLWDARTEFGSSQINSGRNSTESAFAAVATISSKKASWDAAWALQEDVAGKPGLVADDPRGARASFPIMLSPHGSVSISYLASYEHMGRVRVSIDGKDIAFNMQHHKRGTGWWDIDSLWQSNASIELTTARVPLDVLQIKAGAHDLRIELLAASNNRMPGGKNIKNDMDADRRKWHVKMRDGHNKFKLTRIVSC